METKLNDQEVGILREILKKLTIRKRTDELGIQHSMERFVTTSITFKKPDLETLDQVVRKIGLINGINRTDK